MCESLMLEHHSFRSRSLFVLIFHFHHYIIHSVDGYIIRIVMVALHAEVIEVFPEITQMDIITDIGSNRLVCIFKPSGQFNISRSFRSKLKLVVPFVIIGIIGEYIAILFTELKDRPVYIVDRTENMDDESSLPKEYAAKNM